MVYSNSKLGKKISNIMRCLSNRAVWKP